MDKYKWQLGDFYSYILLRVSGFAKWHVTNHFYKYMIYDNDDDKNYYNNRLEFLPEHKFIDCSTTTGIVFNRIVIRHRTITKYWLGGPVINNS